MLFRSYYTITIFIQKSFMMQNNNPQEFRYHSTMSTSNQGTFQYPPFDMEQVQNNNMWSNKSLTASYRSDFNIGDDLINTSNTIPLFIDRKYDSCKCNGILVNDKLVCICMDSTKPTDINSQFSENETSQDSNTFQTNTFITNPMVVNGKNDSCECNGILVDGERVCICFHNIGPILQYCQISDTETTPGSNDCSAKKKHKENLGNSESSNSIDDIQAFIISKFNEYEPSYTKNLSTFDQISACTNPNTNQTNAHHTPEQSHSCVNHACTSQCTLCLNNDHGSCHTHTHMQPSSFATKRKDENSAVEEQSQTKKQRYTINGSDDQNVDQQNNNNTKLFPGNIFYEPSYLKIEYDASDQMNFKYVINIHHSDINTNNENMEYCSSNLFIQKNLSFTNVSAPNLICLNYEKIFKESLSDIQHKTFLEEFNKYKLGQDFLGEKVDDILLFLKKRPILYHDPFYVWKMYHTIDMDIMQFYYVQTCGDEIYNIINNNEKIVIAKLFDENYIKEICSRKIALTQIKTLIHKYINLILTKTIDSNKNNYLNIEITKTDFFKNKISEFINDLNASSLEFEKKEYNKHYESIHKSLDGIKILDSFQFDTLYKIASTEAAKISNPLLKIEVLCLKSFLLDILKNCSESFLTFFPEIVVIIDFLEKSSFFQFQFLNNIVHYKILFMLKVLSDIVQYDWYKLYKANRNVKSYLKDIDRFYIQSAYFSLIKYEITKLLSYCLICFIPEERCKYYAETRILEHFYLYSGTTIPYNNLPNRKDIYYEVGKFNVIARLLFIYETNLCRLIIKRSSDKHLLVFFIRSHCKSELIKALITKENLFEVNLCLYCLSEIITLNFQKYNTTNLNDSNPNNQLQIHISINANKYSTNIDELKNNENGVKSLFDKDQKTFEAILNIRLSNDLNN